ncbi:MAG: RDD family protein [Elusimicrobia bacterium]|nr:RDD family protein [Elusimicrobiota bacterium]
MESENQRQWKELNLASFSERVVAFSVDLSLAVAGYIFSHALIFRHDSVLSSAHQAEWTALWTFLFLLYQAYFSGEGRSSLGKRLLGLRVVDMDGHPLSLGQSGMRSASYLLSSILDIGFLWSLFNPARQCWHDMVVGSVVIEEHPKAAAARALTRAAAFACLSLVAGLWYWNNVASPRYHRLMNVAYAQVGMKELGQLETIYRLQNGRYTDNFFALAPLSAQPRAFMRNMSNLFDPKTGVQITATDDKYRITAHAMDDNRTLVALNGP